MASAPDGAWRTNLPDADELERQQWSVFEERFRAYHEQSLPYRFLPSTPEELAVVVKAFPPLVLEGKTGALTIDHEKVQHASWDTPICYREITKCEMTDGVLNIHFQRGTQQSRSLKMKQFPQQQPALDAFQRYYGRYLAAAAYQKDKAQFA